MVCKDELCASFKNLRSADRIDLMCGLLQLCVPLELRFIGSYLEDLARKEYSKYKELETKANDSDALRETRVIEATKDACGALNIYVSLLHSDNSFCAHVLFNMLRGLRDLIQDAVKQDSSSAMFDFEMANDIILLFTMALHHPAFTFSQRFQLYNDRETLKSLLSDSTVCIPREKNGINVESQNSFRIEAEDNEDEELGSNATRSASVNNSTPLGAEPESVFVKEIGLKSTTSSESRQDYVLEVTWSDDSVTRVTKTYQEISEFHRQLIRMFPSYAGAYKQERVIPFFPQEKNHHIPELLKDYFRKISLLPENFLRCDLMMAFFQDKASRWSSSSSSLVSVNSFTPSTTTTTSTTSSSQSSISSRNGTGISETTSVASTATEEESKPRGNHIRSLTVYNSHMAAEHGTKRAGADMPGKPLRPHMTASAKPPFVPVMAASGPAARHPWLATQNSSILQSTRISESALVCSSPSVASHSASSQSPSISPPQSTSSSSSPVELVGSQNNTSEHWLKQKHFHKHPDVVAANSCSKLHTVEQDGEQFAQETVSAVHRSMSDMDQKRILLGNAVPLVAGGVGGNALISSSATDCQTVLWCIQGQEQLPTPVMTLNNLVPSMPVGIVSGVPPKGPPPGLFPAVAYARPDTEMLDDVDQDKSLRDEMSFTVNDGSEYIEKVSFVPVTQQYLAVNPVLENHVFTPSSLRPFSSSRESGASQCMLIPSSTVVKTGSLIPATSQTNLVTKPARPILGASHRANAKTLHQSDSNGEKSCTPLLPESCVLSTKATISATASMVTITTQSMVLCDGSQVGEPVGHSISSPVLVSPECGFTRPNSLNIPTVMARQSKMSSTDSKGGSAFRTSASRSAAAVSSSGIETGPRGTVSFYHDVPISSPYPLPGQVVMQRISKLPSATQPFPVPHGPPSIPALPPSMPPAIPTPSTTPPILPLSLGNGSANGGACTSCCQCMQCQMPPLHGLPYSYPFMWHGQLVPANAFTFVNGFINSHNLSFPPPSLPPHVPVAAPTFNGISNEMLFNMSQNQPLPSHLNQPQMMGSPLFTTSHCVPFNPNFPPPIRPHSLSAAAKMKHCCPNCGANDHSLGACTETKTSVLQHTALFRLNPSAKQLSD